MYLSRTSAIRVYIHIGLAIILLGHSLGNRFPVLSALGNWANRARIAPFA